MAERTEQDENQDTPVRDHYELLGVSREASEPEIRRAYYSRLADDSYDVDQVRVAYTTLSDPERRAEYDEATQPVTAFAPEEAVEEEEEQNVEEPPEEERRDEERPPRNPILRLTHRLPKPWRVTIDWILTIGGAIAIVLAIKAWVVNPYRIPSSSMEITLHCGKPGAGCLARFSDRVLANRFIFHFRDPERGEIVVFETPPETQTACDAGGVFVKRIIGLPGEVVRMREGRITIDGKPLSEPYVKPQNQVFERGRWGPIPEDHYFVMGDNRAQSCDSRRWGAVPRDNLIGPVFAVYWPPNRIGFR